MEQEEQEVEEKQAAPEEKQDKEKIEAKEILEKKLKMLGVVGVVQDEKTGMLIGIEENGTPKVIDQDEAFLIIKNMHTLNRNRNDYALGDKAAADGEMNQSNRLDTTQVKEAEEKSEEKQKKIEAQQRAQEARKKLESRKSQEDNAMDKAWNKVFGGGKNKQKSDIHRGIISERLRKLCNVVATRAAKNLGKTIQKTARQVSRKIGGRP